jgi:outer membrane receptor protein involved in Fe transport
MKLIFTTLVALLNTCLLFAHNGAIKGRVIDIQTQQHIQHAKIILLQKTDTIPTDDNGKFMLQDIAAGNYSLIAIAEGYTQYIQQVTVTHYSTSNLEIKMSAKKISLSQVTVTSNSERNRTIINQTNLNKFPINSAQDILRAAPGIFIAQHAGGGKAEQIFLRGFDCDHGTDIALSVDGMPVNIVSHAHGQGYADLHFVIPEMINQVAVNKGPYTAQVGNFATAGSIQITTKNTLPRNSISYERGMFNNNRVVALGNLIKQNSNSNRSLIAAAEYNFNTGYFDSPMNLNRMNAQIKYSDKINERTYFTTQVSGFNSFWNASGQIPERAVNKSLIGNFGAIDNTEGGNTSRINFSAATTSTLNNNTILRHQIFYNKYAFNLYSNFTFYKNDTANGDMIQQRENRSIIGYNGSYTKTNRFNQIQIKNTLGLQARVDLVHHTELTHVAKRYTFIKPISLGTLQETNYALYYDKNIAINNKWTFNTALRYDLLGFTYQNQLDASLPNQHKSIFSPKASVYYNTTKKLQLFTQFGKGFHSNDTRVVVQQNGKKILPAAYGLDLGFISKPTTKTLVQGSIWALDLQQEFIYVGDEAVVEAGDATRRLGFDLSLKQQVGKHLNFDIDINYANAKIKNKPELENKIALAPPLTSTGGLSYIFNNQAAINVRYRYLSNRPANEFNTVQASGYTLADAVLFYPYKNFDFTVSAENLLNTTWREAQFETESQLKNETAPVTEIHFTSGTPFNAKVKVGYKF